MNKYNILSQSDNLIYIFLMKVIKCNGELIKHLKKRYFFWYEYHRATS